MGKGKGKDKQRARGTLTNPGPSTSSPPIRVIGLLADDSVIRTVKVPDKSSTVGDVVSTIGVDLESHINTGFGLSDNPVVLDIDNVTIPGIVEYNPEETMVDVANQLPKNTYMAILYTPIEQHTKRITNSANEMVVDQIVSRVENPFSQSSTPSPDKLDELLNIVRSLNTRITTLETSNAALIAESAALRAENAVLKTNISALNNRVTALEGENQDLREAVSGHTTSLYKLRRRILLDQARKKILSVWAPDQTKPQWSDFCNTLSLEGFGTFVISNHVFRRPLIDKAIAMIYEVQTTVRLDGNSIAHEAEESLVRDAVIHGEPGPDVEVLENIFQCVFDKDLGS